MKPIKRRLSIIVTLAAAIIFLAAVWVAGTILSAPVNQTVGNLPADFVGEPVQVPSSSGATLHGWLIPGKRGVGTIILMHGVRATRLSMLDRARFLNEAGYSVLLFDFQAHGESAGEHITFGYLESRDAQAAVHFLQTASPDEKIGVIGVSMGGAATLLASPPLDVDAVVLEMVYPTMDRAVANRLTMRLGGWASILTPLLTWQLKLRLGVSADLLRPIDHVGMMTVPKLFIAGAEDQHTTLDESTQLFNAAAEPKEFWVVSGAGHVDLYSAAKEEYKRRILIFFERHLN